jgi:hypothetical protein
MLTFITTLFIVSTLLLGAWFVTLHALWQSPPPVAAQDAPKPMEVLVRQKLSEGTGQQAATEALAH